MGSTPTTLTFSYGIVFINMKQFIRTYLREGLENSARTVAKSYLKALLNNVHNNKGKEFLNGWIKRGSSDMVLLSPKEANILDLIKSGGLKPRDFHSKN